MRVVNTQDGSVLERTFDRSPVRIGRSSLNELPIQAPFVSQYHAVLEFDGNRVSLRDLGSTNGTALRTSGRVPPNTPIDLAGHNYEFAIVSLWFQLFPVKDVAPVAPEKKKREGTILSMDVGELQKLMQASGAPSVPPPPMGGPDMSRDALARLKPTYEEYRATWGKLYREMFSAASTLDAGSRARLLQQMVAEMTAVQHEGDFQRLATHFGLPPPAPGGAGAAGAAGKDATREESVALQAMRDLASSFVPQRGPLERVVDVVAFAQKMQDTLDVFFKCFLPLRDGHKQFTTQMDIKRTRSPRDIMNAARAVETAKDPRELAARVLDFSDPTNEGSRAIESTFAEVMVHQVAMLNGVMRGVRSLLAKLAPASIEAELQNPRRRAAQGSTLGPFRYKTLWEVYQEVYGDFAEDEKQAFMLIFGPEFVHAYSELAGEPVAGPPAAPGQHAFGQGQNAFGQGPNAFGQGAPPPPPPLFPPPPGGPRTPQPHGGPGQMGQPPLQAPHMAPGQPMVTHPPGHPPVPPPPMVSQPQMPGQAPPGAPGQWPGGPQQPPGVGGSWPGGTPPRR